MSFPRAEREQLIAKRIEQAKQAAESGDGWVALGATWSMTSAGALTWCRHHVSKEIMHQIGQNGLRSKKRRPENRTRNRHYQQGRLQPMDPPKTPPRRWDSCQHWSYSNRQLRQCGAPTENGAPTCKSCATLEAVGTGRTRKDMLFSIHSSRISA